MNAISKPGLLSLSEAVLAQYKSKSVVYKAGEIIFSRDEVPKHFFLLRTGRVKMVSSSEVGKEFVLGYFDAGQSFGEPPLFAGEKYPASAIAVEDATVCRIDYDHLLQLMRENFGVHLAITKTLAQRILYKSMMMCELATEVAEHRLITLLDYLSLNPNGLMSNNILWLTRQQLAQMTGLRVETVIRTVKRMEQKNLLKLTADGKIKWLGRRRAGTNNEQPVT